MAVLEQEGYLVQPHTSAGRVPTDKGYRFFVDHITSPSTLDVVRSQQIRSFFTDSHGALEDMLHRTSRLLAELTSYASVVVGPRHEQASVRSVQVVGLHGRVAMVVAVFSNGAVENQTFEFEREVDDLRLASATAHLSAHVVGRTLRSVSTIAGSGDAVVDEVAAAALGVLRRRAVDSDEPVFVGGTSSMAKAFDAVDTVRRVLQTLEQQYVVVSLMRDVLDRGLSVAIGGEHGVEPLAVCSVVVAPVVVEGEHVGSVGVLGPTRMDYPSALAAVDVVSDRLSRHLAEG
jgi:heat-inducible transcriptional repressor